MANNDDGLGPAITSLIGAIAVVLAYWLHLYLVAEPVPRDNGIEITIFIASFLAQYIPLSMHMARKHDARTET